MVSPTKWTELSLSADRRSAAFATMDGGWRRTVVALAGAGVATVGGLAVGSASAVTTSAAVGSGTGVVVSAGLAAYSGQSVSSAAILGAGGGLAGGAAAGRIAPGLSGLRRTLAAGGAGGAAEGAFRRTVAGQGVGSIVAGAALDGILGAATAGILDRAIVGTVVAGRRLTEVYGSGPKPQLYAYSDRPFKGDVLRGTAGGRPFVSEVAPGDWQTSLLPHHAIKRFFAVSRPSRRPHVHELTPAEAREFARFPATTFSNIL